MKGWIEVLGYNEASKTLLVNCANIACIYLDKNGMIRIDMCDSDYIHTRNSFDEIKEKIKEATQ